MKQVLSAGAFVVFVALHAAHRRRPPAPRRATGSSSHPRGWRST